MELGLHEKEHIKACQATGTLSVSIEAQLVLATGGVREWVEGKRARGAGSGGSYFGLFAFGTTVAIKTYFYCAVPHERLVISVSLYRL